MIEFIENKLAPIALKLGNNKVLIAIRDGFLLTTPLIIVASVFMLIGNFPITGYAEFMAGIFGAGWKSYLDAISNASINLIGVLNVMAIGYSYSKTKNVNAFSGALLAYVSFLILTPQAHPDFTNATGEVFKGYAFGNLSSTGLFLGMIVAIIAVEIFSFATNKGWVIKLPEGVPSAVALSFSVLIPSFVVMSVFFAVRIIFGLTSFEFAQNFIYAVLQTPLLKVGESKFFELSYQFISSILWFFGIHGPGVANTVYQPIHNAMTYANLEAFNAGLVQPYIYTKTFSDFFTNFGGSGSTISLVILMMWRGKSERMKQLGKLSIVPAIFGINEMVIFGLPIVLNPILVIPFIIVPLINTIIATGFTVLGWIPYTTGVTLPWTMPPFFSGWLSTGSVVAGLLQLGLIVLGIFIYYPFFKVQDKLYVEEETQNKPSEEITLS